MRFFLLFFFFFISIHTQAQFFDTKVITADDGLLFNNVNVTFIDKEGYLWLGSRAGLVVKNGTLFEKVNQATQNKFNNIQDILEDPFKGKWIAGYGQGLLFFKEKQTKLFNKTTGLVNNNVRTLFYDKNAVYVGTENGISIISTKDFSISNPKFVQNSKFLFTVSSFFSVDNKVFATTINDGVYEVSKEKVSKVANFKKTFSSIVFNKKLYVSTDKSLLVLNPHTFELEKEFPVGNIWKFIAVKDELYFVASGVFDAKGGLYQLKKDTLYNLTEKYNIPHTDFKSITIDQKNECLYIGTQDNGLLQINLNAPVANFIKDKEISSVCVQNKQQYIFHTKGLSILENNKIVKEINVHYFKKYQEKHPSKYKKQAVIQNHFYPIDYETPAEKIVFYDSKIHNNTLWVASNIGMFSLTLKGEIIKYYPVHVFNFTFFKNQLIMPVPYAGVRVFKNIDEFEYDYFHDWNHSNIPTNIVSIAQTQNTVYFASAISGLYQYKDGKFESLLLNKTFAEPKIKRICTTSTGDLVVVTDFNDVYILDVSKNDLKVKQHISHQKINGSTTFFVNEINGVLYVGTNLGVNVFYKNKYYLIDKAQGFTNYNSTCAVSVNNQLFIGSKAGAFVINNSYFTTNRSFNGKAIIRKVYINNELQTVFSGAKELVLASTQNNVRLYFSVPNVKYPDKLKFKFRLKETEDWQDLINKDELVLNYLNSGNYKVSLQIFDEDTGTVSHQGLISLIIKPPFYFRLPFVLGCVFILITLFFLAYKLRIKYIKQKQQREMQLIVIQNEQKTKQLSFDKQLADVKLQALKSQMNSHFLFNVMSSIQYFIICKDVDNALYYLEQFSKLIRTTLAYSDKKSISLYEEISYLKQYIEIENLRAEHTIVFSEYLAADIDTQTINVIPLLLQPFVENAIVHAFPPSILHPKIELFVQKTNDVIQIILKDNGIGYQEKKSTTHQSKGISIVQTQLELTQQKLQKPIEIITSSKGTQVTIYID